MLSSIKSSGLGVKATTESILNFLLFVSIWARRILLNYKKAGLMTSDCKAIINRTFFYIKSFIHINCSKWPQREIFKDTYSTPRPPESWRVSESWKITVLNKTYYFLVQNSNFMTRKLFFSDVTLLESTFSH